jgi:hypothetical protein
MEIIDAIAKEGRVERLVKSICHSPEITVDLSDLCQLVYLILCEYDEGRIVELWENDQMDFFLVRIILNQYKSNRSTYFREICKFRRRGYNMGVNVDDEALSTARHRRDEDDRK